MRLIKEYYLGDVENVLMVQIQIFLYLMEYALIRLELNGEKAHTYDEWIDLDSYKIGFKVMMNIILEYFRD